MFSILMIVFAILTIIYALSYSRIKNNNWKYSIWSVNICALITIAYYTL